jgi:hypothetical protein
MGARKDIPGAEEWVLQESISAYTDEAYTNAKKFLGTGITGAEAQVDKGTETFIGQLRWKKPLKPVINVVSLTDPTDGDRTGQDSDMAKYAKTVRSHGAMKINMQEVVTQQDGLAQIGKDFAETKAQDQNDSLVAVLKGVAVSEAVIGAANGGKGFPVGLGGQTFDNDPENPAYGFYVDLGLNKIIMDSTAAIQGAARAQYFLDALGMGWKDYEPPYAYLTVTPAVLASLRAANMVDTDKVTEGNIEFSTILSGKFRLIPSRTNLSFSAAELTSMNGGGGVNIVGPKTSMIILPNSVILEELVVPVPVEMERKAAAYKGGGTTDIWYRWGYILHPRGYNWYGNEDSFVKTEAWTEVGHGQDNMTTLAGAPIDATTKGAFERKATSVLSLGILPIFHS